MINKIKELKKSDENLSYMHRVYKAKCIKISILGIIILTILGYIVVSNVTEMDKWIRVLNNASGGTSNLGVETLKHKLDQKLIQNAICIGIVIIAWGFTILGYRKKYISKAKVYLSENNID